MREPCGGSEVPLVNQIRDHTGKKNGVFLCVTAQNAGECSADHILRRGGVGRGMMKQGADKFTLD